jgi:hypothetical protein
VAKVVIVPTTVVASLDSKPALSRGSPPSLRPWLRGTDDDVDDEWRFKE